MEGVRGALELNYNGRTINSSIWKHCSTSCIDNQFRNGTSFEIELDNANSYFDALKKAILPYYPIGRVLGFSSRCILKSEILTVYLQNHFWCFHDTTCHLKWLDSPNSGPLHHSGNLFDLRRIILPTRTRRPLKLCSIWYFSRRWRLGRVAITLSVTTNQ